MDYQVCIDHLRRVGGINAQEAEQIADTILKRRDQARARGAELALDQVATLEAEKLHHRAMVQRIRTARNIQARHRLMDVKLPALVEDGLRLDQAIMADLVGTVRAARGALASVSRRRTALAVEHTAPIQNWFANNEEILQLVYNRRHQLTAEGRAARQAFLDDVVREMQGIGERGAAPVTADPKARELAELLRRGVDDLVDRLNEHGVDIRKLPDWRPQSWHQVKVLGAGLEQWKADVLPRLDLRRSFPELFEDFDPALWGAWRPEGMSEEQARQHVINLLLNHVYEFLTGGRASSPDLADALPGYRGPANLANKMGLHRLLHFKSADDWLAIHRLYGRGDVVGATVAHIEREARNLALIEFYGTNPEALLGRVIGEVRHAVSSDSALSPKQKVKMQRRLAGNLARREGKIAHALSELMGETLIPANPKMAGINASIRASTSLSKLGMATISALADLPNVARALHYNGRTLGESWAGAFKSLVKGRPTAAQREISSLFLAFHEGFMGSVYRRFDLADGMPGLFSTAQDIFHKLTGLTQWTDRLKSGFTQMMSHDLGLRADLDFAALPAGLRRSLRNHGFGKAHWEVLRKSVRHASDGKVYLVPEVIDLLPKASFDPVIRAQLARSRAQIQGEHKTWSKAMAARFDARRARLREQARRELKLSLLGYFSEEAEFAVITGSDRTRAVMTQGTRSGTLSGEILRYIWQFRSFPVNYVDRIMGRAVYGRGARTMLEAIKDPRVVGDLAIMIANATAFGYMAMSAKDLLKGKKPRPPNKLATWIAAFTQGGGAGIYGDFLFGRYNRFGAGLPATMAGAVISGPVSDVASMWADMLAGKISAAKLFRLGIYNTPMINLWFTKAALDYLVLYHLQEMMSPGVLRRRERRMKKWTGQEFLVPPSEVIARGGGFR